MASTTGIELGPDSCVLVSAGPAPDGAVDVGAVHIIGSGEWPAQGVSLADTIRAARRRHGFPRNASVIVWGLPDTATADEAMTQAAVGPIVAAGFRVDSVLTPPQALALLAASRPHPSADAGVAWLALNAHGAAIAIVRGTELLFGRTFQWSYDARPMTPKAQLLQRYSLVAHLAPEVRHGLAAVRDSYGVVVETAVTCGDLPELRLLAMPLIEELDLEVETLDSVDGLRAVGKAKAGRFTEAAPAIRLACAAAASVPPRAGSGAGTLLRVAAAAAGILAIAGAGYVYSQRGVAPSVPSAVPAVPPATTASQEAGAVLPPAAAPAPPTAIAPVVVPPPAATPPAVLPGSRAAEQRSPVAADTKGSQPAAAVPPAVVTKPAGRGAVPEPAAPRPAATAGSAPQPSAAKPETRGSAAPEQKAPPAPRNPGTAIDPMWLPPRAASQAPAAPRALLPDPLPAIDSIVIDRARRVAVIGGKPVGVGDAVGPRVVQQIEPDAVVLREPSGLTVRVTLLPKAPVEKLEDK